MSDFNEPELQVGEGVRTPEGIRGHVTGERWDDDEESWFYTVEWEDGKTDEQSESYLTTAF